MEIFLITLWLGLSIAIAIAGTNREIGAGRTFIISFLPSLILTLLAAGMGAPSTEYFLFLLVSPIMALILVAFSESKAEIEYRNKVITLLEKKQINHESKSDIEYREMLFSLLEKKQINHDDL